MGYWEPDRHVAIQTRSKTAALMDVTRQGTRMGWISSPARRHRPWYKNSNPEVTPHMPRTPTRGGQQFLLKAKLWGLEDFCVLLVNARVKTSK